MSLRSSIGTLSEVLGDTMKPEHDTDNAVEKRGRELYEGTIRAQVETEANIGKIVSIDVHSGDYEVDADLLTAGDRLLARHPDAAIWGERIGYDAVYAVGGALTRTAL